MSNLVKYKKNNIIQKILNFFRKKFFKKDLENDNNLADSYSDEDKIFMVENPDETSEKMVIETERILDAETITPEHEEQSELGVKFENSDFEGASFENGNRENDNFINNNNMNKKQFFELYERVKNNEVDLTTINEATLKKIYLLIQEEIKIIRKSNSDLEGKIAIIEEKIKKIKAA